MKKKFLILIVFALTLQVCQSQQNKNIQNLSATEFAAKLSQTTQPQLVDVRTPEEFLTDHLNNAVNNNVLDAAFDDNAKNLNKLKPVFIYCKAGSRSAKAAQKLSDLGFKTIYNLDGGIMKYNAGNAIKNTTIINGISTAEYALLLKKSKTTVINFYAKWCGPCKKMEPYILKMQAEPKSNINIVRLDADQNKTILDELKLDGLPVIIIYKNQKETYRHIGYLSENDLKKQL